MEGVGAAGAGGVTTNWDTEGGGLLDRETPAEWRSDSRSSVEDTGTSRAGLFRYKVCIWTSRGSSGTRGCDGSPVSRYAATVLMEGGP